MEEKNEIKKGNKILIVTLVLVGLIAIGACVYLLLKGRNGNTKEENQIISNYSQNANNLNEDKNNFEEKEDDNKDVGQTEEKKDLSNNKTYKSADGNFTLRFVNRNELKESDEADVPANEAKYYAYINDHAVAITSVDNPKGTYTIYKGIFFESAGNNDFSFLVDNRTNTLIVYPYYDSSKFSGDEVFYRFSTGIDGLEYALSYLKLEIGEFFIQTTNGPANKLYTTDWKELGWFVTPIYDNESIYVYDNYNLTGNVIMYDANGNKHDKAGVNGPYIDVKGNGTNVISLDQTTTDALIYKVNNGLATVKLKTNSTCEVGASRNSATKNLDTSAIAKVINKLKEAKYVEYMPTSKNCVLYNFSVGSDLIAFEDDDPTVMLVGINGDGFAFHFDESVIDFFKSL